MSFTAEKLTRYTELSKRIRRHIVRMTHHAGSGHPGGSLSATELLTVLFFEHMNVDPKNPDWADRDCFFLSKGHCTPVYYSVLAEKGFFPVEELMTFRDVDGRLHGHPCSEHCPGVDISSGSLGQGLSVANGVALSAKLDGKSRRAYVMIGDGEAQEGQVWEAAMTTPHFGLDNVCAILDWNKIQLDDYVEDVMGLGDFAGKWKSFGWHVVEIDGHDLSEVDDAFREAKRTKGKPTAILAHTVKGKGISYMENTHKWHGLAPDDDELEMALKELV
ncbi:transketolase [Kroppenstedtia eburnea]|uniref:Transketolase n=1 Tax=Kroppenstedtia eburnea TaxID=714067 RepID=A0A1N7IYW8_9BACL|nr:transketolase [Kroppenstedtia eburnea]QKI82345.1 transketolase [Kroppenstedtia eburnea]SIS42322.1 transketolase [Kroppenstedtia eburnea]